MESPSALARDHLGSRLAPLPITVNIPGLLMCENEWISWTSFPGCELEEERKH